MINTDQAHETSPEIVLRHADYAGTEDEWLAALMEDIEEARLTMARDHGVTHSACVSSDEDETIMLATDENRADHLLPVRADELA